MPEDPAWGRLHPRDPHNGMMWFAPLPDPSTPRTPPGVRTSTVGNQAGAATRCRISGPDEHGTRPFGTRFLAALGVSGCSAAEMVLPRSVSIFRRAIDPAQNPLDDDVHLGIVRIVRRCHEINPAVRNQLVNLAEIIFSAIRVIHRDCAASLVGRHLHCRNVGGAVADENHSREWNGAIVLGHELIDRPVVPVALDALIDAEQILGLGRVIDRDSRPRNRSGHFPCSRRIAFDT